MCVNFLHILGVFVGMIDHITWCQVFYYCFEIISSKMDRLEPLASLIVDGNIAEQWKIWRQELELYLTATESDGKGDKVKTSILLTCIGKKGREI